MLQRVRVCCGISNSGCGISISGCVHVLRRVRGFDQWMWDFHQWVHARALAGAVCCGIPISGWAIPISGAACLLQRVRVRCEIQLVDMCICFRRCAPAVEVPQWVHVHCSPLWWLQGRPVSRFGGLSGKWSDLCMSLRWNSRQTFQESTSRHHHIRTGQQVQQKMRAVAEYLWPDCGVSRCSSAGSRPVLVRQV